MNFDQAKTPGAGFQIAPLIDVVFLLLIWFIVTYATAQDEKSLPIRLPRADMASEIPRNVREMVVNVVMGCRCVPRHEEPDHPCPSPKMILTYERGEISLEKLEGLLRKLKETTDDPGVILRVDREAPHRATMAVLNVCVRAGIERTAFSADSAPPSPEDEP